MSMSKDNNFKDDEKRNKKINKQTNLEANVVVGKTQEIKTTKKRLNYHEYKQRN